MPSPIVGMQAVPAATLASPALATPPSSFGQDFAGFASGLRGLTRGFAAGFGRDPARRQEAAYGLAQQEAQQGEQKRQMIDQSFERLKQLAQAVQATGGNVPPALQQIVNREGQILGQLVGDPAYGQQQAEYALAFANVPQAQEPFTLSPGQTRFQGGKPVASVPTAEQGPQSDIGRINADLAAGKISPEEAAAAVKKAQYIAPPAQTSVNIQNVGQIPPEYQLVKDPTTGALRMEKIPGGPSEAKAAGLKKEQETTKDIVVDTIDRSLAIVKNSKIPVTGLVGSVSQNVPGTPAYDLKANIQTIKANVSLDKLQQMRNNSPTGGALGNVSNYEDQLLSASLGALEQSQSQEQFLYNLERVRKVYNEIVNGPEGLPKIGEVRKGYIYKGGGPAEQANWDKVP